MKLVVYRVFLFLFFVTSNLIGWSQKVIIESDQQSLDTVLNSKYFEETPVFSLDGSKIYFTRSGHPQNTGGIGDKGDIWYASRFENGTWGPAQLLGSALNNSSKNGIIGFSNQGNLVLLNSQYSKGAQPTKGFSISRARGGGWSQPENIDIPYFKSQSEFQSASISPDGRTMMFSVMTFGSYGVEDLYFTKLKANSEWSDLRNLGPTINTRFQEMTPFIAPDNEHIYFASNGHPGEGSLDIFVSKRLDDTWRNWTTPVNLGNMVNSIGSETSFSFLPDGEWAVLVSTQNSDGYGDLKKVKISFPEDFVAIQEDTLEQQLTVFPISEPDTLITQSTKEVIENNSVAFSGNILNAKDRTVIVGQLNLISELDSLIINSGENGFSAELVPADYQLLVEADNFLEYDSAFTILEGQSFTRDFFLHPLEVGSTIKLNHVLFERGTTNLIPGSERDLEAVYHMLRNNPSMEIEVGGHTDNQGNFKLNVKLSQERVDEVVEYLAQRGINRRRIRGKGWGPMKPIASNATEESRGLNRRVEFTILKK